MRRHSSIAAAFALALAFPAFSAPLASSRDLPSHPSVAVVFSGGSAFGIAHIGVLKKIEEAGIPVDMVLGTSMGAIVGGLYAAGYSPAEMEAIVESVRWDELFMDRSADAADRFERTVGKCYSLRLGLDGRRLNIDSGLIEGHSLLKLFTVLTAHTLGVRNFDDLPVRYRAVASDIMTGERIVFDGGSLAEAMRASMSIPVVFKPYYKDGRRLVDGGLVDNLPVALAREMGADIVIAIECRAPEPEGPESLRSPLAIASQSANILIARNMAPGREDADVYIRADLHGFSLASYTDALALVTRGEEAGEKAMPEFQALAARIAETRSPVSPRPARPAPPILTGLRVSGGSESDERLVKGAFASLVGRSYGAADLSAAIDAVYECGRFDLVRFDVETLPGSTPSDDDPALRGVVYLTPRVRQPNAVYLGVDYRGVYSSSITNDVTLSSAFLARDLTGPGSAFLASASLVNTVKASAEYLQPLGPFYLKPWARYAYKYDVYSADGLPINVGFAYRTFGAGVWGGLLIGNLAELTIGYSFEGLLDVLSDEMRNNRAGALRAAIVVDALDSSVLPTRGFEFLAYARWFNPAFGGEIEFAQFDVYARTAFPLSASSSLALAAVASTDLAGIVEGFSDAPLAFLPSLRHPGMFYGATEYGDDFIGDHIAGLGIEYRKRLGSIHALLGGDLFAFCNASGGLVAATDSSEGLALSSVRLSICAGMGARVSRSFGAIVAFSLHNGVSDAYPIIPALTVEIGSFSTRVEDLR